MDERKQEENNVISKKMRKDYGRMTNMFWQTRRCLKSGVGLLHRSGLITSMQLLKYAAIIQATGF
jgi:hypothetical protein